MDQKLLESIVARAPKTLKLGELEPQVLALGVDNRVFFLNMSTFLRSEHFNNQTNGQVWNWMLRYYHEKHMIPTRSVIEVAFSTIDVHFSLPTVDIRSAPYVQEETYRIVQKQQIDQFTLRLLLESNNEEMDLESLHKQLLKIINIRDTGGRGFLDYFDVENRYARLGHFWDNRISTGFQTLDTLLPGGGLGRKEMVAIMGPPGAGKTTWLINIAARMMSNGKCVLHITREVSEDIVGLRYDCCLLSATPNELLGDRPATIDRIKQLRAGLGLGSPLFIREYPTGGATIDQCRADYQVLRETENFEADAIIDDYPDLAKPSRFRDKDYSEVGLTFQEFRGWMVEDEACGLVGTQTTRDAEDLRGDMMIQMKHSSDSYHKPRLVDEMFTINESAEDRMTGHQKLFVAKSRNEKSNVWGKFKVDKARMRISDTFQSSYDQSARSQRTTS